MSHAGPSRPRRASPTSTHVFDDEEYDEDADALPGYSASRIPDSAERSDRVPGGAMAESSRRHSEERLLSDVKESPRRHSDTAKGSGEDVRGGTGRRSFGAGSDSGGGSGSRRASSHSEVRSMVSTSLAQRRAAWWRSTLITAVFVCAWYGSATLLSIYNKWMFSKEYYNFPFPLFVTMCHMGVQFLLSFVIRLIWRKKYRPAERPSRQDYVSKIFPTAASTAGDIGLSNLSLRSITLSLYTMCKSSALIFVLLFAFLFRLERFSLNLVGVITLISAGVFLMVFDTTSVNIPGIVMVFSASALSGLRWALTEMLMKKKSMGLSNPFATVFWLTPLMACVLAPVSMAVEGWGNVFGNGHFNNGSAVFTVLCVLFPGVIAFSMVASEYFIIHRAGILPLSVAGVFKEVTTISISAWVFGDQLTELNIIGVVIAVCGIALYAYHKYTKAMSAPAESEPLILPNPSSSAAGPNQYSLASASDLEHGAGQGEPGSVPMSQLPSAASREFGYPPGGAKEADDERVQKRRDDFEGWNEDWSEGEDDEDDEEEGEEEVLKRRAEREGTGGQRTTGGESSWGRWWQKEM